MWVWFNHHFVGHQFKPFCWTIFLTLKICLETINHGLMTFLALKIEKSCLLTFNDQCWTLLCWIFLIIFVLNSSAKNWHHHRQMCQNFWVAHTHHQFRSMNQKNYKFQLWRWDSDPRTDGITDCISSGGPGCSNLLESPFQWIFDWFRSDDTDQYHGELKNLRRNFKNRNIVQIQYGNDIQVNGIVLSPLNQNLELKSATLTCWFAAADHWKTLSVYIL